MRPCNLLDGIIAHGATTLNITTAITFRKHNSQHNGARWWMSRNLNVVMPNVVKRNVAMLSVAMTAQLILGITCCVWSRRFFVDSKLGNFVFVDDERWKSHYRSYLDSINRLLNLWLLHKPVNKIAHSLSYQLL
jgi:hypothetical protein